MTHRTILDRVCGVLAWYLAVFLVAILALGCRESRRENTRHRYVPMTAGREADLRRREAGPRCVCPNCGDPHIEVRK